MESVLVKIFATILTLSQVLVHPNDVKTSLDPEHDRQLAVDLLRQGCSHIRSSFAIEDLNLDDLIATAMDDPQALSAKFHGVRFADLHTVYNVVCKGSRDELPFDIRDVIEFHNRALLDLPDHTRLRDLKLPGTTTVLDRGGEKFAEVFESANRRVSIPLTAVSPLLKAAFIAAEDKRFFEHKGVDERGLIRAFIGNMAGSGGLQGGSTITQQVAKNLLVGTENSYVRKMREVVIASRMEDSLSKDEILQLYLNAIYLGRGAWGVETAAQRYFGKSADSLSLAESALLAGLAKGPSLYNPDRNPERSRERAAYVLSRMKEDGIIDAGQLEQALVPPVIIPYSSALRDSGYHFVDYLAQQAKQAAAIKLLTEDSYVIRSTIDPELQKSAEAALQEGLASYEARGGRAKFSEAELNLTEKVQKLDQSKSSQESAPSWLRALRSTKMPLYDVHWPAAVVLQGSGSKTGRLQVGLADGRVLPLEAAASARGRLKPLDVVHVQVLETRAGMARAELRIRPQVQGTAVVLENRTGRILAMAGGFSYALSQLNRATQTYRQPGSALKPITYLAALAKGLQPNTIISDSSITLPPIGKASRHASEDSYWSPQNYDGSSGSKLSLRQALENSRNLATAHLLEGGIADRPEASLDKVCELAREVQVYRTCVRYYPFILGAQPVRALDLARFYAGIANEGLLPEPHAIESISLRGQLRYDYGAPRLEKIKSADAAAFYQLKSILQGVVLRGTAARLADLAPYVAGKTGTTDEAIDAWFVGFSNDVTVAVWVGYDNAKGRRTLGSKQTGANVALPIFEPIMRASWKIYPKSVLAPPTSEALLKLVPEDSTTATKRSRFQIVEYLRKDAKGKAVDARYALSVQPRPRGQDAFASGAEDGTQSWGWGEQSGRNSQPAPQYNRQDKHGIF